MRMNCKPQGGNAADVCLTDGQVGAIELALFKNEEYQDAK